MIVFDYSSLIQAFQDHYNSKEHNKNNLQTFFIINQTQTATRVDLAIFLLLARLKQTTGLDFNMDRKYRGLRQNHGFGSPITNEQTVCHS